MIKLLIMGLTAIVLFAGTTFGLLAMQGRLNHEGTKGIPVLHGMFPKEEAAKEGEDAEAEGKEGEHKAADAEAAHGHEHEAPGQESDKPLPYRQGKSVLVEEAPDAGGHGGGHGGDSADTGGGHGEAKDKAAKGGHPTAASHAKDGHQEPVSPGQRRWDQRQKELDKGPLPHGLFDFSSLQPDISPERVNELIRHVNERAKKLERELAAVQKMRADLLTQLQDVKMRQEEVSKQMQRVVQEREKLNRRILEFEKKVLMVQRDELEGLKQNARNIESLESETAKELILSWWNSGKEGQERALKTLSVMKKDSVDALLATMTTERIREILDRRLSIARVKDSKQQ